MADPLAGLSGSVSAGLPTKKQQGGLAGLRGGTNAGPRFPMPLDHPSSGLKGIVGHTMALGRVAPAPALKGLTGSAGPKPPPLTPLTGLSGNAMAGKGLHFMPSYKLNGRNVSPMEEQRAVNKTLAQGEARLGKAPGSLSRKSAPAVPLSSKEVAAKQRTELQAAGPKSNLLAAAEPQNVHLNVGKTVENIPSSLQHTITGTIPGLYQTGKALTEAVGEGRTGHLKEIGKGIGELIAHPGKSLEKEPVPVALMFLGIGGGASRLAGAAMRSGALGEKAAAVASTTREPLSIYKGASADQIASGMHDLAPGKANVPDLEIPRTYSPGIVAKGAQRAVEKLAEARGKDVNKASGEDLLRHVYGGSLIGQHLGLPATGLIKTGLVDKTAGVAEMLRRSYTRAAADYLRKIKPKVGAEAVPLAVEGIIRTPGTVVEDLNKELDRLKASHDGLNIKSDQRLNQHNQAQIEGLLQDKKFLNNPQPAFDAAKHYADYMRPHEDRLVELGLLEPNQLAARNVPFAAAHLGYHYNTDPGMHPIVGELKDLVNSRKAAQKRFQRAIGAGDKAAKAEARGEVRDLGAQLQERKYEFQSMKDAGAVKRDGERYPYIQDKNGREVPRSEIEREVARQIPDRRLGFITHKEVTYGQAMHNRVANAPAAERLMRTGESFGKGTYRRDWHALGLQAYKNMNKIAGQETRNNVLNRFGLGRFYDSKSAERSGKFFEQTPEGERLSPLGKLVPTSLGSAKVLSRGHIDPRPLGPQLNDFLPASEKAIREADDGATHTLIPEKVLQRINAHDALNNTSDLGRLAQWYTNKWRSAALYTSPRWMIGNPQEHAIRMAAASINPFAILGVGKSVRLGKDLLDHWATVAADKTLPEATRFQARVFHAAYDSGTHYGSIAMNAVRRNAEDVTAGDGHLIEAFKDTTPVSTTLKEWGAWKGGVGGFMDRIEKNAKAAAIGKAAINETKKFSTEWGKLITREDKAVKAWADGKLDPNQAAKLGEDVNDMLGNWSVLTPTVRRAVQTYSPFGLWWLNSMKFVFKTLPRDHPMKTAALAGMAAATRGPEAELMPSYLEGGIGINLPIVGKVTTTPGYYSPFGIGIEPGTTATSMLFPQGQQTVDILKGREPLSGEKIKGGQFPELATHAGAELLTGITPGARQAIAIAQQGGKPDYASMNPIGIKPGTQRQNGALKELVKQVSPLRISLPPRSEEGAAQSKGVKLSGTKLSGIKLTGTKLSGTKLK